jgi:S1-C subfamily serine protease
MMAEYAGRPTIGVSGGPDDTECVVRTVIPNSAASESGIMVGDRIVTIDGQPVANVPELAAAVLTRQPDDTVTLSLIRGGETLDIEVTLKRRGDTAQPP